MNKLLIGILFLTASCSANRLDIEKNEVSVIKLNFELIKSKNYKVYHKTISFPIDHLNAIDFFSLPEFKKVFAVYNLGLTDLTILDIYVDQIELDYLKEQIIGQSTRKLLSNAINGLQSRITADYPAIIADNPSTLFPDSSTYLVSMPIVSQNGNFALVYERKRCGLDCGGSQVNYYVKNDQAEWEKIGFIITSLH